MRNFEARKRIFGSAIISQLYSLTISNSTMMLVILIAGFAAVLAVCLLNKLWLFSERAGLGSKRTYKQM